MSIYDSASVVTTLEDLANFCRTNELPSSEAAVRDAMLEVQREAIELGPRFTNQGTVSIGVLPFRT